MYLVAFVDMIVNVVYHDCDCVSGECECDCGCDLIVNFDAGCKIRPRK